jgi:hypothetical protein
VPEEDQLLGELLLRRDHPLQPPAVDLLDLLGARLPRGLALLLRGVPGQGLIWVRPERRRRRGLSARVGAGRGDQGLDRRVVAGLFGRVDLLGGRPEGGPAQQVSKLLPFGP